MSDDAGWISSRSKSKNAGPGTFSPSARMTLDRLTRRLSSSDAVERPHRDAVDVDDARDAVGVARRCVGGSRDRAAR